MKPLCPWHHWKFQITCFVWGESHEEKDGAALVSSTLHYDLKRDKWELGTGNWCEEKLVDVFAGRGGWPPCLFLMLTADAVLGRGSGHQHDFVALQNSQALPANSNTTCSLSNRRGRVAYDWVLKNWNPLERFMATFSNHHVNRNPHSLFNGWDSESCLLHISRPCLVSENQKGACGSMGLEGRVAHLQHTLTNTCSSSDNKIE